MIQRDLAARGRRLFLGPVFLVVLAVAGCGPKLEWETTGSVQQEANASFGARWPSTNVPVCWTTPGFDVEKGWVRTKVEAEFGRTAARFTGWGDCSALAATTQAVRIALADTAVSSAIGRTTASPSMTLNFTFQAYRGECSASATARQRCIESSALHAFGHAAGLRDEAERIGRDPDCAQGLATLVEGDAGLGPWDTSSVMNLCRPSSTAPVALSTSDVSAVNLLFGRGTPSASALVVGLESFNLTNHFIRHSFGQGQISPLRSDPDTRDASFKLVPGLAGADGVSLESVNYPGQYLRQTSTTVTLQPAPAGDAVFAREATFRLVAGLAGAQGFSLQAYDTTRGYLRHALGLLSVQPSDGTALFRSDATWKVKSPSNPVVSLRSSNLTDHYVRHKFGFGHIEPIASDLDKSDASFRVVPGLSDPALISLESVNLPGQFLRHQNGRLRLHAREETDLFRRDATFRKWSSGLAGGNTWSLEASNIPNGFIRHKFGELWVDVNDGSALFKADASFTPTASFVANTTVNSAANPVLKLDFPDPFILRVGSTYYGYATNNVINGVRYNIPVAQSSNLLSWSIVRDALPTVGSWADGSSMLQWAPGVLQVSTSRYVLYYVSKHKTNGMQCIGRAVSSTPAGPYSDTFGAPLVCDVPGFWAIDPSPYRAKDGSLWLLWRRDSSQLSGAIGMAIRRLAADGASFEAGSSVSVLLTKTSGGWEDPVMENPALVEAGGKIFLFYSANDYQGANYGIGYGECTSITGPCTKKTVAGPWMRTVGDMTGAGGQDFFTDTSGNLWMAAHGWSVSNVGYENGGARSLWLYKITVENGAPTFWLP